MSGSKLLITSKYHIKQIGGIMLITFLCMCVLAVIVGIVVRFFDSQGEFNGMETVFSSVAFIAGLTGCRSWLKYNAVSGVSRKTEFLAVILTAVAAGLLYIILDLMLNGFSSLLLGGHCSGGYEMVIAMWNLDLTSGTELIFRMGIDFSAGVTSLMEGYCIGLLFYRLNKMGKTILIVACICLIITSPFLLYTFSNSSAFDFFLSHTAALWNWLFKTPAGFFTENGIEFLIAAAFAFLLVRRAPIKG